MNSITASGRRGRRGIAAVAAILVVVLGAWGLAASLSSTQSAWNDATYTSAVVTSGEWSNPTSYGCVAMNANGTVKSGGTCRVTALVFDQWGNDSAHYRNYYVTVESNAGNGYVQLTLDLSAGTMRQNGGTGTWKWGNAATTGGELTPTSKCSALPTLVANSPIMWQTTRTFYFSATDNRNAASSVTCG